MIYDKQQIKRELHERNLKANDNFRRTMREMYRDDSMFKCISIDEINDKYHASHGQTKGDA